MCGYRHGLTVRGEIQSGQGLFTPITVSQLSEERCQVLEELPEPDANGLLQVWLGALGPLRARISAHSQTLLEFDGLIHPAIVAHFNA